MTFRLEDSRTDGGTLIEQEAKKEEQLEQYERKLKIAIRKNKRDKIEKLRRKIAALHDGGMTSQPPSDLDSDASDWYNSESETEEPVQLPSSTVRRREVSFSFPRVAPPHAPRARPWRRAFDSRALGPLPPWCCSNQAAACAQGAEVVTNQAESSSVTFRLGRDCTQTVALSFCAMSIEGGEPVRFKR